ncbi:hypothetical protein OESDEN_01051 [Oesophagostomum dentatum]|uniref:Uncharacterized protein n=1 Tax=Oesophagostomum dentatum TaxID=61180 RepID=A0A0B1TU35_OESDE|nr:hypothetical protein OESDEN_01051 [Oesophagostomum dentatum]
MPIDAVAHFEEQEDLLDLSIGAEEDVWNMALAPSQGDVEVKQSTPQKGRLGRKERRKRQAEETDSMIAPRPKMTLRPLLFSHDNKGFVSGEDVMDIFHSILDVAKETERRQHRIEDTHEWED